MTRSPQFWSHDGETFDRHDTPEAARAACRDALADHRAYAHDDGEWPSAAEDVRWGTVVEEVVEVRIDDGHVDYELRPVVVGPSLLDQLLAAYRTYFALIRTEAGPRRWAAHMKEVGAAAAEVRRLEGELSLALEQTASAAQEVEEGPRLAPTAAEGSVEPGGTAAVTSPATADLRSRLWVRLPHPCPECAGPVEAWTSHAPPKLFDPWRCTDVGHHGTIDTLPPGGRLVEIFLDGSRPHPIASRAEIERRDPSAEPAPAPPRLVPSPEECSTSEDAHELLASFGRGGPRGGLRVV